MIKAFAPGKLMIAGEWAVLEKGSPAIVAAIDKGVYAEIRKSEVEDISISIGEYKIRDLKAVIKNKRLSIENNNKNTLIIKNAIETVLNYQDTYRPFKIRTYGSKTIINGKKVGFGSSAAATVAIVAAVLKFYRVTIEKEKLFKLSCIAHFLAQGKMGSGFDVAASAYGGIIAYQRFDDSWLSEKLNKNPIKEIVDLTWPGLSIETLSMPKGLNILVGWTGEPASTTKRISQMTKWKINNKEEYSKIINSITFIVEEMISAWKACNKGRIKELLKKNEVVLRELGQKSGVNIETEKLKRLCKIVDKYGGAGKLSGAGGGDCGIAVVFDKNISKKIKEEWEQNGIIPIDVKIALLNN